MDTKFEVYDLTQPEIKPKSIVKKQAERFYFFLFQLPRLLRKS